MSLDQTTNFVRENAAESIGSTETTISVDDASTFPDPNNGNYNVVIWDYDTYKRPDEDPDVEIMRVTGRDTSNDTISVTRGQEATAASSHPTTSDLHLAPTSKMFADIDSQKLDVSGDQMGGTLDLNSNDLEDGSTTIWNHSGGYLEQSVLENTSVTVAGNSVSLGASTAVDHTDLSNIATDDHHTKYTDENAQDAVGTILGSNFTYDDANDNISLSSDTVTVSGNSVSLGGSVSVAHNDLSNISTSDHHSKTNSASELSDVSADSVTDAHHVKYTDESAQDAVGTILGSSFTYNDANNTIVLTSDTITVAGNSVSLGASTSINHNDLSNISSDDHHSKYTNAEARNAVEGNSDAADLLGSSGSAGQVLTSDGSNASWEDSGGGTGGGGSSNKARTQEVAKR